MRLSFLLLGRSTRAVVAENRAEAYAIARISFDSFDECVSTTFVSTKCLYQRLNTTLEAEASIATDRNIERLKYVF